MHFVFSQEQSLNTERFGAHLHARQIYDVEPLIRRVLFTLFSSSEALLLICRENAFKIPSTGLLREPRLLSSWCHTGGPVLMTIFVAMARRTVVPHHRIEFVYPLAPGIISFDILAKQD